MNKSEIAEPLEATAGRWLRERGIHSAEINLAAVLSEFHLSVMDRIVENERAIAESQAPPWGTATSYCDDETGALLWKLDNVAEECGDTEEIIELNAANFRLGTTVQVCEPEPPEGSENV